VLRWTKKFQDTTHNRDSLGFLLEIPGGVMMPLFKVWSWDFSKRDRRKGSRYLRVLLALIGHVKAVRLLQGSLFVRVHRYLAFLALLRATLVSGTAQYRSLIEQDRQILR
jgi:hypothetical protein